MVDALSTREPFARFAARKLDGQLGFWTPEQIARALTGGDRARVVHALTCRLLVRAQFLRRRDDGAMRFNPSLPGWF